MNRFSTYFLAFALLAGTMGALSGVAYAQEESADDAGTAEASQETTSTVMAGPGGALVGFRASERLSNPQAWQISPGGDIRFCYVITEVTDESGESFYLEEFQLRCTQWR